MLDRDPVRVGDAGRGLEDALAQEREPVAPHLAQGLEVAVLGAVRHLHHVEVEVGETVRVRGRARPLHPVIEQYLVGRHADRPVGLVADAGAVLRRRAGGTVGVDVARRVD